ncbi:MAG: PAS domain-containing protein [Methylococcaceae bacterium]|nr:PAS domain-containing protein [Methylococcaceae bacterium]
MPENTKKVSIQTTQHDKPTKFPVVGIGSSAGGLEALEIFFAHLPPKNGMAFIIVTHQQPNHLSLLPELLAGFTEMPVVAAENGILLQQNQVYVCPPGKNLGILNRRLHLMDIDKDAPLHLPIDYFFRSLAADLHEMAIGIILSGTGTDGTLGLKAIKGESGMIMVQEPKSAKFDGMPCSAITMGDVDFTLPPEDMGKQLLHYTQSPLLLAMDPIVNEESVSLEPIQKVFMLLRNRTGHDLSNYKQSTIRRRIARRMNIHQLKSLNHYVRFLQENPHEIDCLFKELLINVTNFFRDPEAFQLLADKILPDFLADKPDNYEMRLWIPACSSGEEVYSLAIILLELMEQAKKSFTFQIFATDLDTDIINRAREGLYPCGIAADVSASRLQRFFKVQENNYRIQKEVRDKVVFAVQNVIKDPPFTHIDLISCRNFLIYLNADLQKQLMPQFHYALNPDGLLFLGSSESIGNSEDLFSVRDKKWKLYQRKNITIKLPLNPLNHSAVNTQSSGAVLTNPFAVVQQQGNIARQIEKLLLERYAPVSIIINEHGKIFYIHGRTGKYLEPASGGQPNWNVIEMAREGLRMPLVAGLRKALKQDNTEIISEKVRVKTNGDFELIDVKLIKIAQPEALMGLFLLSFHPSLSPPKGTDTKRKQHIHVNNNDEREQLEQELLFTKESLRATIEELETSNEELCSTNEELQSTNEELQSSNEELETSKEEMQSLNEELITVNEELHNKVDEYVRSSDDLQNLLNSTDIASVFLDNDLRIKRFTKQAQNIISLIDTDIGRPLSDQASHLKYPHLIDDAKKVLETLVFKDKEVQTVNGDWYLLRILPYRTAENMIDGLAISFININKLKLAEQSAVDASVTRAIVETVRHPLLVLDEHLQILLANPAFFNSFKLDKQQTENQSLLTICAGAWATAEIKQHLKTTLDDKTAFEELHFSHEFPDIGLKHLILNGRILKQSAEKSVHILLAIEDVTTRHNNK